MTFKRVQNVLNKRSARIYNDFEGCHYGYSRVAQPSVFADICDFDCINKILKLRDGKRKNGTSGFDADIDAVFPINLKCRSAMGQISDGVLSIFLVDDISEGKQRFYTWGDVKNDFADWQEVKNKTWREILNGE